MEHIEELNRLIQEYVAFALSQKQESRLMAMLKDKSERASEHPAHEQFYQDVGAWTEAFLRSGPDAQTLREAVEILLLTASAQKGKPPYWYLLAIQGYSKQLIPLLEDADREALSQAYEKQYPRNVRLPVQDEILRMLKKQGAKKGFFSFLK